MDKVNTPPIRLSENDLLCPLENLRKRKARSNKKLCSAEKSSRRMTRALSRVQGQSLQDTSVKIIKLDHGTFMAGACSVGTPEVEPSSRCSATEIFELDSSETSHLSCHGSGNDIVDSVKEEASHGNDDALRPKEPQSDKVLSLATNLPHETESHNPNSESPNPIRSDVEAQTQPLDPPLEDARSQSITFQNETNSPENTNAFSFSMPKDLYPILEAITNKYGDITEHFTLKSTYGSSIKSSLLEGVCKIVLKTQNFPPADLESDDIVEFYKIIEDAESVKFDVNWLRQYLDNVVKAMEKINEVEKLRVETKEAEQKKVERENAVKMKKAEKRKLEFDIELLQEQLRTDNHIIEQMKIQINSLSVMSLDPII